MKPATRMSHLKPARQIMHHVRKAPKGVRIVSLFAPLLLLSLILFQAGAMAAEQNQAGHKIGHFIWNDLFTTNMARAEAYYGKVFGWQFGKPVDRSRGIRVITMDSYYIGNAVGIAPEEGGQGRSRWLCFIEVENVESSLKRARAFGGMVPAPPRTINRRGTFGLIRDPGNAAFAVTNTSEGVPLPPDSAWNRWLGAELWTADVPAMMEFYATLFGYDMTIVPLDDGEDIAFLRKDAAWVATITHIPWTSVRSEWIPFLLVSDVEATCAKVLEAGGQVLVQPEKGERIGYIAIIADPMGAVMGIQQHAE